MWLPTRFGKSLCYEVLLFVRDHKLSRIDAKSSLVLVVSPLVTDQVCSLRERGVKAAVISSGTGFSSDLVANEGDLSVCSHS